MTRFVPTIAVLCAASLAVAADMAPQSFVNDAATAGMAEVELGRVAAHKSSNAKVKQFAQMMVRDHSHADSQLKAIAKKEHVALPKAPTAEQQATVKDLKAKSGSAFDSAYASQMVQDHQKAVDLFQQASKDNSLSPELRSFAQKTLPTLQHHLEQAQKLNDAIASR